ncbi:ShlB/FhaC/HecB family hemolysin secretion/activation protein [Halopseudomonas pelagia]|uniref:ShlB/FhaC/HecB family hemolysin secretion/activation protein n=1 Tax=Halopseudomonas pelagia TaxID=553151 RepID=UPI003C6D6071
MHDFERRSRLPYLLGGLLAALPLSVSLAFAQEQDAAATQAPRVNINEYIVRGNTVLNAREIENAVYPFLGPERTLADVESAQQALQKAYQDKGYQSVYVELPEQQVTGGVVILQIMETRVGRVRVVGAKHSSPLAIRDEVPALTEGKVPDFDQVQEELTELGRTGQRQVMPMISEGQIPGTMDVELTVEDRNPWSGSLTLNNDYSADTEKLRSVATLGHSNLWQKGHSASLTFFTAPEDTNNAEVWSASYSAPLNERWSLRFSGYHSESDVATVGGTNVLGKGHSYGMAAIYSLPFTGDWMHTVSLGLDVKSFDESVQFGGETDDVPLEYMPLTLSYNGYFFTDQRQGNFGVSLVTSTDKLFGSSSDWEEFDYKRYKASPDFSVLKGTFGLTDSLPRNWELATRGEWQIASGPLVSNEQFSAGGSYSVRGYLAAEQSSDDGFMLSAELRTPSIKEWLDLPVKELRLHAFVDSANMWLQDAMQEQDDKYELASVGIGARAEVTSWLHGSFDLGYPLVDGPETERHDAHAHFSLTASF